MFLVRPKVTALPAHAVASVSVGIRRAARIDASRHTDEKGDNALTYRGQRDVPRPALPAGVTDGAERAESDSRAATEER
jgi:hypothetical protein